MRLARPLSQIVIGFVQICWVSTLMLIASVLFIPLAAGQFVISLALPVGD